MANYDELSGRYEHVYVQSGKMFEKECLLAEQAIANSFAVYQDLVLASREKLDARAQHIAALFYRNCVYLSAAYHLIRNGMLDPAGNNLRTVFETIIWQYAYMCDDDIYSNYLEIEKLDSQKLMQLPQRKWSNTKERDLENLRRKYNFQKMMKSLYSKDVFEKFFFNQYWILCQKSHSSIVGANLNTPTMEGLTTMEKNPKEISDNLLALAYLCSENLICYLNCFGGHLQQKKIDEVLKITNQLTGSIPPAMSLAPDAVKKELRFVVRFREI